MTSVWLSTWLPSIVTVQQPRHLVQVGNPKFKFKIPLVVRLLRANTILGKFIFYGEKMDAGTDLGEAPAGDFARILR